MPQNVQVCGACSRRYRPEARCWAGEPAGLRSGGNVPSLPQGNTLCGRAHGRISGESQPPLLGRPLGKCRPWATKGELQQTRRASTLDVMVPGHVKAPRPKGCAVGCCTCRLGAAGQSEPWRACLKKSSSPFARRRCLCKQRDDDFKSGSPLPSPCGQRSRAMSGAGRAAQRRQAPSIHLLFGCRVGTAGIMAGSSAGDISAQIAV